MTKPTSPAAGDLARGSLINARYRVVDVVGRGGLATVYRADDESLGRTVALKVISGSLGDADDARRHEDEVRLIAGFDHPALVTLFDFVPIDDGPAAMLVMQFVDGTTLASRIARGPLSAELTAEIGADVAAALAHIHDRGVIHRDVKPANILIPDAHDGPAAMLADFGIARLVDEAGITTTGTIVGTASYLSPEQARGGTLGPATDIYSLGLVLLESLTGKRAFPGNAVESVAARLSSDPVIPERLEQAMTQLLAAMLAREPAARPEALEVERQLREFAGAGSGATLVLPVASTAATERLTPAVATERLTPAVAQPAATPKRAPRRPFPVARVLVFGVVILGGLLILAMFLQTRPTGLGDATAPPAATASPTPTATQAAEVVYPDVPGKLGDALAKLQDSVSSLDSDTAAQALQARVLEISNAAADEDYDTALDAVDELRTEIDGAELTAPERDDIRHASDEVRAQLDKLTRGNGKPGKG